MKMNIELIRVAKTVLIADEGFRNKPYRDSKGYWSIGVGRLIGALIQDLKLSDDEVEYLLYNDMKKHWSETVEIFGQDFLKSLDVVRQTALLSLVFNLGGTKLLKFHQTLPAIKAKNWKLAGELLRKSKWAKDVDPKQIPGQGRDDRIIAMLETGKLPSFYKLEDKDIC